jgi:DNA-binding MarR family transcriptional regulator
MVIPNNIDTERAVALEIRSLMAGIARMAHRSLEDYLNQRGYNLSMLQMGVLYSLHHESQTISELSRHFNLDPSTLVPTIDALERKQLLVRGRDPNDRRRVPLSLTEQGISVINEISIVHENDALLIALRHLGTDQSMQLLSLLRSLTQQMPGGEEWLCKMQPRLSAAARLMAQTDANSADSE